jgi:hypothetical protein
MIPCPSDRNPFDDDDGIVIHVVIDGVGYAWDENDNVWREGKPENDYDDGYRKIGVLKYDGEELHELAEKLINFVRSIKEN